MVMKTVRQVFAGILGLVLLCAFVVYLITYTVGYNESAVVITFGRATAASVKNVRGEQPGLYFKLPWPIQKVLRFDRRLAILEDRLEQQETSDKQVVIVKAYLTWRIVNPLGFYRMFHTREWAQAFLLERLRVSKAELASFSFDDLANSDPAAMRIGEAEAAMLTRIRDDMTGHETGIEIVSVGIHRILLPENITTAVFERMKQTRQRYAQNARSEGNAIFQSIIAKTDSDKRRILAFAERIAQRLRAEGDASAARYYREYSRDPDFAIFLRKLDALEQSLGKNTTFILNTDSEPLDLLESGKK